MAVPEQIEWSALSPASKEIVLHVGLRLAAGQDYREIAAALERDRPELRHVPPLPRGTYTKPWVQARMRDVRREIEQTPGAASF